MTPYERGYAAGLKAAEKVLHSRSMLAWARYKGFSTTRGDTRDEAAADALEAAMYEILSLPIEGEATNAGPNATQPVAESQAPAPSEPGDRGVAPTLADSRPARSGPCVVVPVEPTDTPINPVVQEAIDNFGRYYAERHKLGMSIRSDMQYIARLAVRWAEK